MKLPVMDMTNVYNLFVRRNLCKYIYVRILCMHVCMYVYVLTWALLVYVGLYVCICVCVYGYM